MRVGPQTGATNGAASITPVELAIEISPSLPRGLVWFPEHFTTLKDFMNVEIDPVTHVPSFKSGPVSLKKVPLFDLTVVASDKDKVKE